MAGRIREESIAEVREKAPIEEVVSQYVTLKQRRRRLDEGSLPLPRREDPVVQRQPGSGFLPLPGGRDAGAHVGGRPADQRAGRRHAPDPGLDAATGSRRRSSRTASSSLHKITLDAEPAAQGALRHRRASVVRPVREGPAQASARSLTTDLKKGDRLVSKFPRSTDPPDDAVALRHRPRLHLSATARALGDGSMALLCPPKDLAMLKWFPNSHTTRQGRRTCSSTTCRGSSRSCPDSTSRCPTSTAGSPATSPLTAASPLMAPSS